MQRVKSNHDAHPENPLGQEPRNTTDAEADPEIGGQLEAAVWSPHRWVASPPLKGDIGGTSLCDESPLWVPFGFTSP